MAYLYCGDSRFGRSWADPDEVMRSLTRQFAIVDREKLKIHEQISLEYVHKSKQQLVSMHEGISSTSNQRPMHAR